MASTNFLVSRNDRIANNDAAIQDASVFTWAFLFRPSAIDGSYLVSKGTDNPAGGKRVRWLGFPVTPHIRWSVQRGATQTEYRTSAPAIAVDEETLLVITFDSGASPSSHIYIGTDTTAMVEATYSTATSGSGTVGADAAAPLNVGHVSDLTTEAVGLSGDGGMFGFWVGRVLTLTEAETLRGSLASIPALTFTARGPLRAARGPAIEAPDKVHAIEIAATIYDTRSTRLLGVQSAQSDEIAEEELRVVEQRRRRADPF